MNKLKKRVSFILCLGIIIFCSCFLLGVLSACKDHDEYVKGRLTVSIAPEYKNAFLEKEFTIEDFKSPYIENIRYGEWYSIEEKEIGFIIIQLKEQYANHIDEVMQSLIELDFVVNVERVPIIQIPEI